MPYQEDFYTVKDSECILEAINEKIWDNDVEFIAELDVLIRGIEKNFQKVDLIVKTARNCIISNLVFQGTKILNTEKYNQSKKKVVQVQL